MRINFESKKEMQDQRTALSYKTFKQGEEITLACPSPLSSSVIELAEHIRGIHGLDYNGVDYNGEDDLLQIKLRRNKWKQVTSDNK